VTGKEPGQPFLTRKQATAWGAGTVAIMIVLTFVGEDVAIATAAAMFAVSIALAIRVYWTLRHHWWFWIAAAALVLLHSLLVIFVPWPAMHLSGQGFLPIAFVDVFANCGYFALSARIIKVSTSD